MTDKELMLKAEEARLKAYTPYSGFKVGAALLAKSGKVYLGCNIENAAYTPTNCAERTAFFKAVSEGKRDFSAIAVVAVKDGKIDKNCTPCGVCRQVLAEFCGKDFKIIMGEREELKVVTLGEILPFAFTKDNLEA